MARPIGVTGMTEWTPPFDDQEDGEDPQAAMIRLIMILRRQGITDTRILSAIERVPRHLFISERYADQAYWDTALPIDCDQTISQPFIVAMMTQALQIQEGDKVLEIGTGSGYQAAILAQLTDRVYTIERHRRLLLQAEGRFNELGIHTIATRLGDGLNGWVELAPFDQIIVTAAGENVPAPLLKQLRIGGKMVMPIGNPEGEQRLVRIKRTSYGLEEQELGLVRFVPLVPGVITET